MAAIDLSSLSLEVARKLGMVREGTTSANGAADGTTLIDTVYRTEEDDYWNLGTCWITSAGGAAPEGEVSEITDFANGTATVTLRGTGFTGQVDSGDSYAVAKPRYPYWVLKQKINEAAKALGTIKITDKSSITTAESQTEYTLPDIEFLDLRRVWLQTKLNDTNDYQWTEIIGWDIERTAAGTQDILILPDQPPTGRLLKLEYMGVHGDLSADTDVLSEAVHRQRMIIEAAIRCLLWRRQKIGDIDPSLDVQMNMFMDERTFWMNEAPIKKERKTPRYVTTRAYVETDDFSWPDPP